MGLDTVTLRKWLDLEAKEEGFFSLGVSKSAFLEREAEYLEQWLKEEHHGTMQWMESNFDKRTNPAILMEGCKSVISVLYNYFPPAEYTQPANAPKISRYAWGRDYHQVLKEKLYRLAEGLKERVGDLHFRVFTDSAPVMDKVWAARGGLGWIGKHTNLIVPQAGSWFFIGEILTDLELPADGSVRDYCGSCTRCIDACPTQALSPYEIDARKCISYLTIELRDSIPDPLRQHLDGWAFGCDICQEVCPWNSFASSYTDESFQPLKHLLEYGQEEWRSISKSAFNRLTRPSAMSRIRFEKWLDNLDQGANSLVSPSGDAE